MRKLDKKRLDTIIRRGVVEIIVEDEFVQLLQAGKPLRLKMGFDPSRPDIHLGHVVGLRKLRQLQNLGHQVILIVGDWTAQIGDPSGQSATRPMLSHHQVMENAESYLRQFFKIVDEDNHIVSPGIPGELMTRGYSVMLGYWNDPEITAEAIDAAGWMHTGDQATIDEEGFCKIVGRIKDMVIRGGENVYPREIEEFLYRHPKVQDVQVIGVPDEKYGEELCAWISLKDGEHSNPEEIRAFCKGQIAHYKVPRYVKFVDEFPMTITGKVQKFKMRETMISELSLIERETA